MSVTVIIASIPTRTEYRQRSIKSALKQTMKPDEVMVEIDYARRGAALTRDLMLKECHTKYVCVLDDDDWLLPNHIETLYGVAEKEDADLVYPWHRLSIEGHGSHLEKWRGVPWDNNNIHQVPITWLAKTSSLKRAGGFAHNFDTFSDNRDETGNRIGEDYLMIHKMVERNMKIIHVDEETWVWNWDGTGTHGRPDRW
jgi:glycosyltransferase involved in cell wall biosynthesis